MKTREVIEALDLKSMGADEDTLDYEISVDRIDADGKDEELGGITDIEYNHETKFIIIHVARLGC